jgi:nucleoside phosphorylase
MKRVLILTALDIEYKSVRAYLSRIDEIVLNDGSIFEQGIFTDMNERKHIVYIGQTGAGNIHSALSTQKAITRFLPDLIFFVGVAGGIKDVNIGDVVVADKIYTYEFGKDGYEFLARPDLGKSSHKIVERARVEARKDNWYDPQVNRKYLPKVIIGNLCVGEKVIISSKSEVFKNIKKHYNDSTAVEMEGFGFMEAIFRNGNLDAAVIRGISDLIDNKDQINNNSTQKRASKNASAFTFHLISKLETGKKSERPKGIKIRIEATIPSKKRKQMESIISKLNKIAPDIELERISTGSTTFFFTGSTKSFRILKNLFKIGELDKILNEKVLEIEMFEFEEIENPIQINLEKMDNSDISECKRFLSLSNKFTNKNTYENTRNPNSIVELDLYRLTATNYEVLSPPKIEIVIAGRNEKIVKEFCTIESKKQTNNPQIKAIKENTLSPKYSTYKNLFIANNINSGFQQYSNFVRCPKSASRSTIVARISNARGEIKGKLSSIEAIRIKQIIKKTNK